MFGTQTTDLAKNTGSTVHAGEANRVRGRERKQLVSEPLSGTAPTIAVFTDDAILTIMVGDGPAAIGNFGHLPNLRSILDRFGHSPLYGS
jgi:hypothetical protein